MTFIRTGFNEFLDTWIREFREIYDDSGNSKYYGDYIDRMQKMVLAGFAASFLLSVIGHLVLLNYTILRMILASLGVSLVVASLVGVANLYYPIYQSGNRKSKLEDNLVYSLSYMAVLSASGMPIERIINRLHEIEEDSPLKDLSKKFIINTSVFGYDVLTALRDLSDRSPSDTFSKIIYSIRTSVYTSGDLETILTYEFERQLQEKKESLKKMLGSLVYIGELYVTMMVVSPILFILMLTILSVIGGRGLGGSSILQLNLIVFFGIPVMAATFIILLDMILGEEE
jgi:flagellar protein FlaJ